MAFADKKGIALAGGFKLQAESPLDARQQVDTIEERDELVTLHAAWEGMQVYVKADKKTYEYHGADGWSATVTGVAYVHPTTAGNKHIPAGGATGNILGYAADGTAKWLAPDKTTVGLDKVDNTSDKDKPVSTAQKAALDKKVDKVEGKGLSANDYTDEEKTKLAGIEDNANKYTHPATHSIDMITETETLKVMTAAERTKLKGIEEGANKYTHPASHPATMIVEDATHRFATDTEKTAWNAKADVLFADEAPATAPAGAILYCTKRLAAAAKA